MGFSEANLVHSSTVSWNRRVDPVVVRPLVRNCKFFVIQCKVACVLQHEFLKINIRVIPVFPCQQKQNVLARSNTRSGGFDAFLQTDTRQATSQRPQYYVCLIPRPVDKGEFLSLSQVIDYREPYFFWE